MRVWKKTKEWSDTPFVFVAASLFIYKKRREDTKGRAKKELRKANRSESSQKDEWGKGCGAFDLLVSL